jgi:hypothetical protein
MQAQAAAVRSPYVAAPALTASISARSRGGIFQPPFEKKISWGGAWVGKATQRGRRLVVRGGVWDRNKTACTHLIQLLVNRV